MSVSEIEDIEWPCMSNLRGGGAKTQLAHTWGEAFIKTEINTVLPLFIGKISKDNHYDPKFPPWVIVRRTNQRTVPGWYFSAF